MWRKRLRPRSKQSTPSPLVTERSSQEGKKLERHLSESLRQRIDDLAHSEGLGDNAAGLTDPVADVVSPGDLVITPLGLKGKVVHIQGSHAEVLVGDKRIRVPITELKKGFDVEAETVDSAGQHKPRRRPASRVQTILAEKTGVTELNLIGCNVEEAVSRTDKFLDDAVVSDVAQVRLVHGHGTGRLRKALRSFLDTHPLVASRDSESHDGATLVTLKD